MNEKATQGEDHEGGDTMVSFRHEVELQTTPESLWNRLLDLVEHPMRYMRHVERTRVIKRDAESILAEIEIFGMTLPEEIQVDLSQWAIRWILRDNPHFSGQREIRIDPGWKPRDPGMVGLVHALMYVPRSEKAKGLDARGIELMASAALERLAAMVEDEPGSTPRRDFPPGGPKGMETGSDELPLRISQRTEIPTSLKSASDLVMEVLLDPLSFQSRAPSLSMIESSKSAFLALGRTDGVSQTETLTTSPRQFVSRYRLTSAGRMIGERIIRVTDPDPATGETSLTLEYVVGVSCPPRALADLRSDVLTREVVKALSEVRRMLAAKPLEPVGDVSEDDLLHLDWASWPL